MLESRLSQAPLSFPILAVGRHQPVSDEWPELVPDRALDGRLLISPRGISELTVIVTVSLRILAEHHPDLLGYRERAVPTPVI